MKIYNVTSQIKSASPPQELLHSLGCAKPRCSGISYHKSTSKPYILHQNPSREFMWYQHPQSTSLPLPVIPVKSWKILLMVSQKRWLPSLGYICKHTTKHHQKIPFRNLKLGISLQKAAQMILNWCYLQALWFIAAGSVSGTQHLWKTLWNKD